MTTIVPVRTVLDRLREHAKRKPSASACVFVDEDVRTERILTYAEVDSAALAVATALRARLSPGDRALLLLPEGPGFVPAFLGCLRAGVIAVPAYPLRPVQSRRRAETLRAIAANCRPAAVIIAAPDTDEKAIRDAVPELAHVWWARVDDLLQTVPDAAAERVAEAGHTAFLQYTSGTTAMPRGVDVTHGALAYNLELLGVAFGHDEQTRMAGWLPMYHDMGLIGNLLHPLWLGGTAILMRPMAFLKRPSRWLRMISRYHASTSGAPDFAYELCTRRVNEAECLGLDLSGWKVAFNGADSIRGDTLRAFAEKFAPYGFDPASWYPCYGLAEATLMVTGSRHDAPPTTMMADRDALRRGEARPSGAGRLLIGSGKTRMDRTVLIVDPGTGQRAEPGRIGEIWIGGPSLPAEYWNNPEATRRTFAARLADDTERAFLRSGDLGFLHDGELYVTGRCQDIITFDGRTHYPRDIEVTVEKSHRAIRAGYTTVFSVNGPDAEAERVVVIANARGEARGAEAEAVREREEIRRAVRAAVAAEHGLPVADVVLAGPNAALKTSSGKLQRGAVRDAYLRGEYASRNHDRRSRN